MKAGQEAFTHHVLMLSVAIVGERLDGDASAGIEQSYDLQIFGIHQLDKVLHDDVHTVLVEVTMVAEAEEIEFQALALHHQRAGDIIYNKVSEIRLTRLGTQRGKLGAIQGHKVLVFRVFVLKRFQHLRRIIVAVLRVLIAQESDAFQLLFVS